MRAVEGSLAAPLKSGRSGKVLVGRAQWKATQSIPLNVAWHLYSMELAQKSDEEILQIADPIMDNLMQASTEINHERHVRDFTERLKSLVTKDYLEKVCRQYQAEKGYFLRREFVAVFRRPTSVAIVWKQWFTKLQGEFVAFCEQEGGHLAAPSPSF